MKRRAYQLVVVLAILVVASIVFAQTPSRRIGFRFVDGFARVDFSVKDLATKRVTRKLSGGLKGVFVVKVSTINTKSRKAIHSVTRTCSVTYNLWGQNYVVRSGGRSFVSKKLSSVLEKCLVFRKFATVSVDKRVPDMHLDVLAEFNPVSEAKCRQLLRAKRDGSPSVGPLVINIVKRELCRAERTVRFRSQPLLSKPQESR